MNRDVQGAAQRAAARAARAELSRDTTFPQAGTHQLRRRPGIGRMMIAAGALGLTAFAAGCGPAEGNGSQASPTSTEQVTQVFGLRPSLSSEAVGGQTTRELSHVFSYQNEANGTVTTGENPSAAEVRRVGDHGVIILKLDASQVERQIALGSGIEVTLHQGDSSTSRVPSATLQAMFEAENRDKAPENFTFTLILAKDILTSETNTGGGNVITDMPVNPDAEAGTTTVSLGFLKPGLTVVQGPYQPHPQETTNGINFSG